MPTYHNSPSYFVCPNCGAAVPGKAKACPSCGADERTGWSEDTHADDLNLPQEFSYDEFMAREFGSKAKPPHLKYIWWITAILLLIAMIIAAFEACYR